MSIERGGTRKPARQEGIDERHGKCDENIEPIILLSTIQIFDGALLFNFNTPDDRDKPGALDNCAERELKTLDRFRQLLEIDGLGEITGGAFVKRLSDAAHRRVGRHYNDFHSRLALGKRFQQRQPINRSEFDIEQRDVKESLLHEIERFFRAWRRCNIKSSFS